MLIVSGVCVTGSSGVNSFDEFACELIDHGRYQGKGGFSSAVVR